MITRASDFTKVTFGYGKLGIGLGDDNQSLVIQERKGSDTTPGVIHETEVNLNIPPVILTFLNGSGIDLLIEALQLLKTHVPSKMLETARESPVFEDNVIKFTPKKKGK